MIMLQKNVLVLKVLMQAQIIYDEIDRIDQFFQSSKFREEPRRQ